jgi:hypothetical protein
VFGLFLEFVNYLDKHRLQQMISKYEQDSAKISRLAQSSNLGQSDRAKMRTIFLCTATPADLVSIICSGSIFIFVFISCSSRQTLTITLNM